ncbi:MAG: diphthine--ammonia ligase [Candidatus Aenigmatarchaeota archaeon]|nr:MAG: diphthine--ammonia ligase [Candidatus Aenigmarchaeota archaeon]
MEVACLFSGGKDSTFAAYYAKKNYKLKYLVTAKPKEGSYMFHYPNIELTKIQAKLIGVKHIFYESCSEKEKEVEELKEVISKLKIDSIIAGAIASEYQRSRILKIAKELNLKLISPIWKIDEMEYLKKLIYLGFKIIITGVSAAGFTEEWLGREIDKKCLKDFKELNRKYKISIVGEGGEYESFVLDCPIFNKRIEILDFVKHMDAKINCGWLEIKKIKLVEK